MPGLASLWHGESFPWHAALTVVPFILLLLPDQRLHIVKNVCIYTYLTAYRLYMNYRSAK